MEHGLQNCDSNVSFCTLKIFSKKKKLALNCPDSLILLYYWVKTESKTLFGKTPWRTGRHATPLVTLFFGTASATDLRERFLLSGVFYLTLHPAGFKASSEPAVQPQS